MLRAILGIKYLEEKTSVQDFSSFLTYIFFLCLAIAAGIFLLIKSRNLLLFLKPDWLRRNVITFCIGFCFFVALGYLIPDFRNIIQNFGWLKSLMLFCLIVVANVLVPYNLVTFLTRQKRFKNIGFFQQQVMIFCCIVFSSIILNGILNYWLNDSAKSLRHSVLWSFYIAGLSSVIYLLIRYYDLEGSKTLHLKEMELSRLREQKMKAELDALYSKVNPHFLYNALNSIADLTMSDGKKARKMTLALADLFRHSINYNKESFATVEEEVELAKLYLEIERIRFEDRLSFSTFVSPDAEKYVIPRFLLQPILENAVKHGLRKTETRTEVSVSIYRQDEQLVIQVFDSGPAFPKEFKPGYGMSSVYEKLELFFKGVFTLRWVNEPQKHLELRILKPVINASPTQSFDC